MQEMEYSARQDLEEKVFDFLFDDVEMVSSDAPLATGDIYGRFDYEDPVLLLQEARLKHLLLELEAGRPVDVLAPLTQLAMSLTPSEVRAMLSGAPSWAYRSARLRLAHSDKSPDRTRFQISVLHDETMSCVVALGTEALRNPAHREEIYLIRAALLRAAAGRGCKRVPSDPRQVIQEMVLARHGSRAWAELTRRAEEDLERLRPEDRGHDALCARLIERGAELLQRPRDEFLYEVLTFCNEMAGRIPGATVGEVLEGLNSLHQAMAGVAPNYPVPTFERRGDARSNTYVYDATDRAAWSRELAESLSRRFGVEVRLCARGEVADGEPRTVRFLAGRVSVLPPGTTGTVVRQTVAA